jgi:hypothetical protein
MKHHRIWIVSDFVFRNVAVLCFDVHYCGNLQGKRVRERMHSEIDFAMVVRVGVWKVVLSDGKDL